jgi:hypothetical protein
MSRQIRRTTCEHEWIADFDPVADAAAYNDGLSYRPAFQVCTKCGRKKRIGYEPCPDWGFILWFPFILVGVLVASVLVPIYLLVASIYEALLSKRKS